MIGSGRRNLVSRNWDSTYRGIIFGKGCCCFPQESTKMCAPSPPSSSPFPVWVIWLFTAPPCLHPARLHSPLPLLVCPRGLVVHSCRLRGEGGPSPSPSSCRCSPPASAPLLCAPGISPLYTPCPPCGGTPPLHSSEAAPESGWWGAGWASGCCCAAT